MDIYEKFNKQVENLKILIINPFYIIFYIIDNITLLTSRNIMDYKIDPKIITRDTIHTKNMNISHNIHNKTEATKLAGAGADISTNSTNSGKNSSKTGGHPAKFAEILSSKLPANNYNNSYNISNNINDISNISGISNISNINHIRSLNDIINSDNADNANNIDTQNIIKAKSQEFESFFLFTILQEMFKHIGEQDALGGGSAEKTFRMFLLQNYAEKIAKTRDGIGIARQIEEDLVKNIK